MPRQTIPGRIAKKTGVKNGAVKTALEALADVLADDLAAGESVTLPGIGKFTVIKRRAGEAVQHVCRFEFATILKQVAKARGG